MIQKLNALMDKAKNIFFYLYLGYVGIAAVGEIMEFIEACQYSGAAYIAYRLFLTLWYLGIYATGVYFLLKKNNEHTKLYFTLIFGFSIVSHFYNAWTWIYFFDEIYNPTFVTVSKRMFDFVVALAGGVFGVSYILSLFIKKDFFKYITCSSLLALFCGYVFSWLIALVGTFTGELNWISIFATLVSIMFVVIMAVGLPLLKGEAFDYKTFGQNKKNAKEEVSTGEESSIEEIA